jgi:hypothetical protein
MSTNIKAVETQIIFQMKNNQIEYSSNNNLMNYRFTDNTHFLKNQNSKYSKIIITSDLENKINLNIDLGLNLNVIEVQIYGEYDELTISGDTSKIKFGGGCNYDLIQITTSNLPNIYFEEVAVNKLILKNENQNSTLFFGVNPSIKELSSNQKNTFIYTTVGYDNMNIKTDNNQVINYIVLDPLVQKLNF